MKPGEQPCGNTYELVHVRGLCSPERIAGCREGVQRCLGMLMRDYDAHLQNHARPRVVEQEAGNDWSDQPGMREGREVVAIVTVPSAAVSAVKDRIRVVMQQLGGSAILEDSVEDPMACACTSPLQSLPNGKPMDIHEIVCGEPAYVR